MKDPILAGYLADFATQYGVQHLDAGLQFERFAVWLIISRLHSDFSAVDAVVMGGGHDTGIDGFAVIVNDRVVTSEDEIRDLLSLLKRIDVRFVFIQAKSSSHFSGDKIGTFLAGVGHFFDGTPVLFETRDIRAGRRLKDYIYKHAINFGSNPICECYFVTTGTWLGDQNLMGRADMGIRKTQTDPAVQ